MKLLRYGDKGAEKPGLLDAGGTIRDLSGVIDDIDATVLAEHRLRELAALEPASLPAVGTNPRLGPPVAKVGKFLCIGLNYSDHAAETNSPIPAEPILFMKATSAITGPDDPVIIPRDSEKTDWEVELGVVIGREVRYIDEAEALDAVAGYCVINDVSERAFQLERSGQWVKGKSADSFGPMGPYLVTRDEVADPQKLRLWLEVDGKRFQDGSTETMVFGVAHLISYVSRFMSLQPGDVISTGTPPGVGMGQKPQIFLRPGNVIRLGVEGLGEQHQVVQARDSSPKTQVTGRF